MRLSVFHRLRHGHWYEPTFVPISDYLDWRVCGACRRAERTAEAVAEIVARGQTPVFTQIFREPFSFTRTPGAVTPEAMPPSRETVS